jgi:hypothetical protein
MSTQSHSTEYDIGAHTVALAVTFDFVPAIPERGPSYASGGEPACPAELDVCTLEWSVKLKDGGPAAFQWNKIERGPLFDLIAADLYDELYDRATSDDGRPE